MRQITEELAQKIYNVLVVYAEASESDRINFVWTQVNTQPTEYRLSSSLGFGGKFWNNSDRLYVTCYQEDETPERMESIAAVNHLLDNIDGVTSSLAELKAISRIGDTD